MTTADSKSQASALFSQGRAAEQAGNNAAAEAAYRGVVAVEPEHQEALRRLGALVTGAEGEGFARRARRLEADALAAAALQLLRLGKLREAASPAKRALQLDKENVEALRLSALLSSAVGEIEAAEACYQRLLDLLPGDREASLSLGVLRGEGLAAGENFAEIPVAPHLRLRRFLAPGERERALAFALSQLGALDPSTIFRGKPQVVDRESRSSQVLYEPQALREWFIPKVRAVAERAMRQVGLEPFEPGRIELQLTLHRDGDFYKVHADRNLKEAPDPDNAVTTRKLTFVYYLSRLPQRFSGGELKLYKAAIGGRGYDPAAGVLLGPEDNSIVFFPSVLFHEVRPVRLESEDPGDGRFTLNGWIHERIDGRAH